MPRGKPKSAYPELYRSKRARKDPFAGSKLADQPDHRDTPESRAFADGPHNPKPLIVDGAQDRLPPGTDESSIGVLTSPGKYDVPEGWGKTYVLKTAGTSWENHTAMDNLADFLEAVPGSFVVHDKDTKKEVRRRDTVLVAIPPEHVERSRKDAQEREKRWFDQIRNKRLGEGTELEDNRRASKDQLEAMAQRTSEALHASGMIGDRSWSSGLSLEEAVAMKERREGKGSVEAEKAFYREAGRAYARSSDDIDRGESPRRNTNRSISAPGSPTRRG